GGVAAAGAAAAAAAAAPPPEAPQQPENPVEAGEAPADMFKATEGRWGTREVEITSVTLEGEDGAPGHVFQSGEAVTVRMRVRAHEPTRDFVFGFGLFNADGVCCYGTNTNLEDLEPEELSGECEVEFAIDSLLLVEGTYRLDLAVHKLDGYPYDYHRQLYSFRVKSRVRDVGIYRPGHTWRFTGNVRFKNRQ
ncbi:MAG: Wzt carbohydrate-binding domain-containing protein, partial [Acidobacteriota bacterium]